jgi:prophage DNA circulation protein
MGQTESTSIAKTLYQSCVNVTTNILQQCTGSTSQAMVINLSGGNIISGGNLNFSQTSSVSVSCAMTSAVQDQIANAVANQISNAATANGTTVSLGSSGASSETDIATAIKANINTNTTNEVTSAINQTMTGDITNENLVSLGSVDITQDATLVSEAIMNSTAYQSVLNNASNQIQQSASATTSLFSENVLIAIAVIIGLILAYRIYSSSHKNKPIKPS